MSTISKKAAVILVVALALGALFVGTVGASDSASDSAWWAEYYSNPGLYDSPVMTRYDSVIDFNWGRGSPDTSVPVDYFSVRWTRNVYFDGGSYSFYTTVDDGIRLWVDGYLVLDSWYVQPATSYRASRYLAPGVHTVQMVYFEASGDALVKLWWEKGGGVCPHPPCVTPTPSPVGTWHAEYYDNRTLSGAPRLVREDWKVDFNWGNGSPDPVLPNDTFSARWKKSLYFEGGAYMFYVRHDDGARLWVDNTLLIDNWQDQAATTHSGSMHLLQGYHEIRLEYYEHFGEAVVNFWCTKDGGGPQPYPTPGPHPPPPGNEVIVDNNSPGFKFGGTYRGRLYGTGGYGGDFFWTYTTMYHPVNYGKWIPSLAPGNYAVYVYIPGNNATSTGVRYRVLHNGQRHDRIVNQAAYYDQWVSLGRYYFSGSTGSEFVLVYDNTHEPYGYAKIAYDAVKFVPDTGW